MKFWRFGGKFLYLLNWFFVWSSPLLILIKKATYGGNYVKVCHFENRKCPKIAIFDWNATLICSPPPSPLPYLGNPDSYEVASLLKLIRKP